jgi:hypothetical protein
VGGGAEDVDAAGGVFDDREDVQTGSGQRDGFDEVGGQQRLGLRAEEVGPGGLDLSGAGSMPASRRICQTVEAATLIPRVSSSPWTRR